MSIKAIDWAFRQKVDNPGAKLLLIALANYANDEDCSYPSLKTLKEVTSIPVRTLTRLFKFLEKAGLIKREARFRPNGSRTSSRFHLGVDELFTPEDPMATVAIPPWPNQQGPLATVAIPEPLTLNHSSFSDEKEDIVSLAKKQTETENIKRVFAHWQTTLNHPGTKFTKDRETKIRARLREGYSTEQLFAAIDGCAGSAWHMGENNRHERYDGVELIFRNSGKTDDFIRMAGAATKTQQITEQQKTKDQLYKAHCAEMNAFYAQFAKTPEVSHL